jgi:hypothetical protein
MESHSNSCTVVYKTNSSAIENKPTPKLSYKDLKIKPNKKVTWTEDTVNNEHMGKKKSKSKIY